MLSTADTRRLRAFSSIEEIEAATTIDELKDVFAAFLSEYGFENFVAGQIWNPEFEPLPPSGPLAANNWPKEWERRWLDRNYILRDPIVRFGLKTADPFSWEDARNATDQRGRLIMEEGAEFGIADGISVPFHRYGMRPVNITLSTDRGEFDKSDFLVIKMVSFHFVSRLELLWPHETPRAPEATGALTVRERDVLLYAASGKKDAEIAERLHISAYTVAQHVKTAMKKLGASNRTHAVTRAIINKEIVI